MLTTYTDCLRAVGPQAGRALQLTAYEADGSQVVEGVLTAADDVWYPIVNGVPCFLRGALRPDFSDFAQRHALPRVAEDAGRAAASSQAKTSETFSDKWRRFKMYGLEPQHQDFLFGWYCKKFGLQSRAELEAFYRDRKNVLEVGPGSGFNTRFIAEHCKGRVFALDVSDAAHTTFENTKHLSNCAVVQADLMDAPFADGFFDLIVADGVLHHTPNTRSAVAALLSKLKPGGQFYFYLYRKMGAARQFVDGHIREQFGRLSAEECYAACEGLTELGRELSRLNAAVTLEHGIPALGIPPGTHDVQRLFYYNFVKCFWNEAFDFQTNNMVNFDWYHPHDAWQHTQDEVEGWLHEFGVDEYKFHDSNPNGISVLLTKNPA